MSQIIQQLKALTDQRGAEIDRWFEQAFEVTRPSFYSSVDIRHFGHKLAPVDTNLFPAGFNHLSDAARQRARVQIQHAIKRWAKAVDRVLIIPENHTRNLGYLDNLRALASLFEEIGIAVQIGSLAAERGAPVEVELADGALMVQQPLMKVGNQLQTEGGFVPDLVVVNNDLTSGSPDILRGVTQCIVPPLGQGWYRRRKSIHFDAYARIAAKFAADFGFDSWLIHSLHHRCGKVQFRERQGLECVAIGVEKLLHRIREKYAHYGIADEPYVFIKADSGTYGMGIMTARSGDEVLEINKKVRNKMHAIKEGVQSTEVIIQEGVPTVDRIRGEMAEPMLYLIDGVPVGGAYRVNSERDATNNLNARGMHFVGMCDEQELAAHEQTTVGHCDFTVLGLIARLATLAAAREEYGEDWVI